LRSAKLLVVNADDFGFTPDVNSGIIEAHRRGILTAATLMANGAAFDDAVRRARQTPSLDIGCHLVLVGGRSLVSGKPLPATLPRLAGALARRELRLYDEFAAQVRALIGAGIQPTHLDTHKHTHLAPPVLEAVACVAKEFGIHWVRRPFDFPLGAASAASRVMRAVSEGFGLLRHRFHRVLAKHGCRATDHFAGFQITGHLRTPELVELLNVIPEGSTELMCHPGHCREALQRARTRLRESRQRELGALVAPEVREAISHNGIKLVNYRMLTVMQP